MPTAWLYRKPSDLKRLGDKKAPWYVRWYQEGRQKMRKIGTKSLALDFKSKIEGDLIRGEIQPERVSWDSGRKRYEDHLRPRVRSGTFMQAGIALDHFARLMGKIPLREIATRHVDAYAAKRLSEKSKSGKPIKAPTVNKELRQLRAFLRRCKEWKLLREVPSFTFVKETGKLPTYIDADVFSKLYDHCNAATAPAEPGFTAEQWWRAFLTFLFMTGWRAREPLSVTRDEYQAERGMVVLRGESNKGSRDELVPLHPLVVDHLAELKTFSPMLFPWPHGYRRLWDEFHLIQQAAGVARPDGTPYGFHDFRRGFATLNADRMTADALQRIMRHRDYGTTQRYINIARQLNPAVANLFVPELPGKKGGAS